MKHGKEHDEYYNPTTGVTVQIERHGSQEVRKGLASKLRKQIGFYQQGRGGGSFSPRPKKRQEKSKMKIFKQYRRFKINKYEF